ncbi:MAG: hypothetical protein ACI4EV_01800 [Lachnospiraceae bacterium]
MNLYLADVKKGIKRRKKDLKLLYAVWFAVIFFVTVTLIYQEYSDKYKFESDKRNYGDWVASEVINDKDNQLQLVKGFSYFDYYGTVVSGINLRKANGDTVSGTVGFVDENLIKLGYLEAYEGRLPQKSGEIAMESTMLQDFGLSYQIGQSVKLKYNGQECEFVLTGIIKRRMPNWDADNMPNILISQEDGIKYRGNTIVTYFYHLDKEYAYKNFYEYYYPHICKVVETGVKEDRIRSNTYLGASELFGSRWIYTALIIMLVGAGMAAVSFVQAMYIRKRRSYYYCMRTIGVTRMQMSTGILLENFGVAVPGFIAGFVAAVAVGAGAMVVIYINQGINLFELLSPNVLLIIVLSWLAVAITSTVTSIIMANRRKLYENSRNIPLKFLIRKLLNRLKSRHIYSGIFKRQHKVFKVRSLCGTVLGISTAAVIIFLMGKIWHSYYSFNAEIQNFSDYTVVRNTDTPPLPLELEFVGNNGMKYSLGGNRYARYHDGFSDTFMEEVKSIGNLNYIDFSTVDNSHIFDWDGREKEPYICKYLDDGATYTINGVEYKDSSVEKIYMETVGVKNSIILGYRAWYSDNEDMYEQYEKMCENQCLDKEKFMAGEQIIVMINEESSLTAGDIFRIETTQGDIEVTVGAVIKDRLVASYPVGISSMVTGGYVGADIYASEALGRRIAAKEGNEFKYNLLTCNMGYWSSVVPSLKALINLTNEQEGIMQYNSNAETNHKLFNEFMKVLAIYGLFVVIILTFFIIMRSYMVQAGLAFYGNQVGRLRLLGMEKKQIKRMYFFEGIYESRFLWVSIIIIYLMKARELWYEFVLRKQEIYDPDINEFTNNFKSVLKIIMPIRINLWISLGVVVLLAAVTILTRYFVVHIHLKKSEL